MQRERGREDESFQMLVDLFEMTHIDNMRVLRALIYSRDYLQPVLYDGSTKKMVRWLFSTYVHVHDCVLLLLTVA
jgi:hypothetical protein